MLYQHTFPSASIPFNSLSFKEIAVLIDIGVAMVIDRPFHLQDDHATI